MLKFFKIIPILIYFLSFNTSGMEIFIETPNNGTITLEVDAQDTVESVKVKIQHKIGIDSNTQILHYSSTILENQRTLSDYNIQKNHSLQLTDSSTLGVDDVELNNNKLNLKPNPSNNFIKISGLTKPQNYTVYNILGAKIINGVVSNKEKINIQNLKNGLYYLKFKNGDNLKFIKE